MGGRGSSSGKASASGAGSGSSSHVSNSGLPTLQGTEKQVQWANQIRQNVIDAINYSLDATGQDESDTWFMLKASNGTSLASENQDMSSPNFQLVTRLVKDAYGKEDPYQGVVKSDDFAKSLKKYDRSQTKQMTPEQRVKAGKEVVADGRKKALAAAQDAISKLDFASYWIDNHKKIESFITTYEYYKGKKNV